MDLLEAFFGKYTMWSPGTSDFSYSLRKTTSCNSDQASTEGPSGRRPPSILFPDVLPWGIYENMAYISTS